MGLRPWLIGMAKAKELMMLRSHMCFLLSHSDVSFSLATCRGVYVTLILTETGPGKGVAETTSGPFGKDWKVAHRRGGLPSRLGQWSARARGRAGLLHRGFPKTNFQKPAVAPEQERKRPRV